MERARKRDESEEECSSEDEELVADELQPHAPNLVSSAVLSFDITPIHREILDLAEELIEKHYTLDSDTLYSHCSRYMKDHDKRSINIAYTELFNKRVLVHGKAVTKEKLDENPNRKKIIDIITENPGIHASQIQKQSELAIGVVRWHLQMLEEFGAIRRREFENKLAYYHSTSDASLDGTYAILNKKGNATILKIILERPEISFADLLSSQELSRGALMRKVKDLISNGILKATSEYNQMVALEITGPYKEMVLKFVK
ncbi:MAG: winged helix-turn-helix transcriptional regulator [Candidatus Hodarchaeota archaeon]